VRNQVWFAICKTEHTIHQMKVKSHWFITRDAEKAFVQIQHHLVVKSATQSALTGTSSPWLGTETESPLLQENGWNWRPTQ
jgi:hypothetical protein